MSLFQFEIQSNATSRRSVLGHSVGIRCGDLLIPPLLLFIGLVSAYDAYLVIEHQHVLHELNPIGRWLIAVDDGSVGVFIGCKVAGTVVALGLMVLMHRYLKSWSVIVVSAVAGFQALLALYLTFG